MKYDGLGRRIYKAITNCGDMDGTYKFFYDGQRVIETHDGSGNVIKHKVWGPTYVDELAQVGVNTDPGTDDDMDDSYVILDDANFNVIGMMNDDHDLIERREYHPYGRRQVFKQRSSTDAQCTAEIPHPQVVVLGSTPQAYSICDEGHQGLPHDKEIDVFNNRARYTSPTLCRSTGRDPKDYIDGNNLYAYLMDSPGNGLDPTGAARLDHGGNEGDAVYLRYKSGFSYPWEPLNEYKVGYLVKFNDTWFIQGRNEKGTMSWGSEYVSLKEAEEWAFTRHGEHAYADKWRKFALSRRANTTRKTAQREGERQWNRANRAYKPDNSVIGRMGAIAKELPAGWYETAASGEQLASLAGGIDGMVDTMVKPGAELIYQRELKGNMFGTLFGVKDGGGKLARAYGTGNTIGVVTGHVENVGIAIVSGKALWDAARNAPAMINAAGSMVNAYRGGAATVVLVETAPAITVTAEGVITAGTGSIALYNEMHAISQSGSGGKGQRPKNGSTNKATQNGTNALSRNARDVLREEARQLWQNTTGRRARWDDLFVHHRIPLEWSHLMPGNPNDLRNLAGVTSDVHKQINNMWTAFRTSVRGTTPTSQQIMKQVLEIDKIFGKAMKFIK